MLWQENPTDTPNCFCLILFLYFKGWEIKHLPSPAPLQHARSCDLVLGNET